MTNRQYDIVVFGATGFTGQLVAEYLARRSRTESTRWAIAGRSAQKLDELAATLGVTDLGRIVADVADRESMSRLAADTQVVATTVGPYARYGEPVVRACVEAGTDYVDITGEPQFVDMTLLRYHAVAREKGIRVVSCCGFDSIPHDLGVYFTVRQLPENIPLRVEGFVRAKGAFSGGTWNSAIDAFSTFGEVKKLRKERRSMQEKLPPGRRVGSTKPKVHREHRLGGWAVPLPTIDSDVVLRSAALDPRYGPDFRYGHYVRIKKLSQVVGGTAMVAGIFVGAQWRPTRSWLKKMRSSGDGPSAEQRARSRFEVVFLAEGGDHSVRCRVAGGDPGYDETAKMLGESALCLAHDRDRLPGPVGVVPPAGAMGQALLDRLIRSGLTFEVLEN